MKLSDMIDLVALGAVWGASFLFMLIAAPEFGPLVLVEVRVVIAALFLLPIFLLRANISELTVQWKKLAILSVLNSAAPFFLLTFATLSITGGFAGILNATAPIFAAVVAWVWLSDRLGVSQIVGLVIGLAGVLVLVWNKVTLDFDGTTVAILAAIIMGVASTGIAYILYFRLIRNVGPVKAITVTYLIPAFAMFWGAIVIDEKVTPIMLVGCAIIFFGTALATGMLSFGRRLV